MLGFAIDNRQSFHSVKERWHPEVNYHMKEASVVVVGLKRVYFLIIS